MITPLPHSHKNRHVERISPAQAYHDRAADHVLHAIAQDKLAIELRSHGFMCAKIPASYTVELLAIAEALSDYAVKLERGDAVFPGVY